MSRMIETLGYGLIATAIVGGSLYGLARYAENGAPAAASKSAQTAPSPVFPAPRASYPAPTPASLPPSTPSENFVRAGNKIYYLASTAPAQFESATYEALRRNCYEAANNNREGEYPYLQQSACTHYAEYARQYGRDTGPLPAYGTPQPQAPQQVQGQAQQEIAYEDQEQANSALLVECRSRHEEGHVTVSAPRGGREPRGTLHRVRPSDEGERREWLHCGKH